MSLPRFNYSPFKKPVDEITTADIPVLKDVHEGWHVEYKRELKKAEKAASSIASFANAYGGWIIYGIDAPSNNESKPTAFPGVPNDEVAGVLEILQRGASTCLGNDPYYEPRVLQGPCSEVSLPENHSLVVVRVPPGPDAPYLHQDGRIYRRVQDAKKPAFETDKHVVDMLFKRSKAAKSRWTKFVDTDFTVSDGETDVSYVHVFLSPDPYGARGLRLDLEFDDFVNAMKGKDPLLGGIPCDNFFHFEHGFVARQIAGNNPYNLGFTWRQHRTGAASVSFPLPAIKFNDDGFEKFWRGYKFAGSFTSACDSVNMRSGYAIDFNSVPFLICSILLRYRVILEKGGIGRDFVAKARLDNIWRKVPFFDTAQYAMFVRNHGVPVCQVGSAWAPPLKSLWTDIAWDLVRGDKAHDLGTVALIDTLSLTHWCATGLGLDIGGDGVVTLIDEWQAHHERIRTVQINRTGDPKTYAR